MKNSKLLMITVTLFSTLALYACVPGPDGGPHGDRPSVDELFSDADQNGDNVLSKAEFESVLPK